MSTFFCERCQRTRDKDFVGFEHVDGRDYCAACKPYTADELDEMPLIGGFLGVSENDTPLAPDPTPDPEPSSDFSFGDGGGFSGGGSEGEF